MTHTTRPVFRTILRVVAPRSPLAMYAGIVALALAASALSLRNGFALDDVALIVKNGRVHSLADAWRIFTLPYWPPQYGASLYRPAVTLGQAFQWSIGDGAPWVFHATSVALYAAASALVLALFRTLLPPVAAGIGAGLFAVHPVHVEAVSNAVGQSELVAGSAMLAAALIYIRRRRAGSMGTAATASIGALFGLACLAKEHGVLLPAILLVLEWLVVPRQETEVVALRTRLREMAPVYAILATVVIAYAVVRTSVVGDVVGEKDVIPVQGFARLGMVAVVVPHWLRLLVWPARLSADYSPQQVRIPDGFNPEVILGLVLLVGSVGLFIALGSGRSHTRLERSAARFGLALAAIALVPVSNLFYVIVVAERALFLPSVGAMLVVGAAASVLLSDTHGSRATISRALVATVTTTCLALGVVRSNLRHQVWYDDATLFAHTVQDAPRSYRAQFFYGQILFGQGRRGAGERHLRLAIALNPTPFDVSPLNYLATQYRDAGMCPHALPLYEQAFARNDRRPDVRYGLASCLLTLGRPDDARRLAEEGVRRGSLTSLFQQLIVRSDSAVRGSQGS